MPAVDGNSEQNVLVARRVAGPWRWSGTDRAATCNQEEGNGVPGATGKGAQWWLPVWGGGVVVVAVGGGVAVGRGAEWWLPAGRGGWGAARWWHLQGDLVRCR
jgi:hypothetical protein